MQQPMMMSGLKETKTPSVEELLAKKKLEEQQMGNNIESFTEDLPTEINNSAKYQKMMQLMQPQQNQVDSLAQQRQKTLQRLLGA